MGSNSDLNPHHEPPPGGFFSPIFCVDIATFMSQCLAFVESKIFHYASDPSGVVHRAAHRRSASVLATMPVTQAAWCAGRSRPPCIGQSDKNVVMSTHYASDPSGVVLGVLDSFYLIRWRKRITFFRALQAYCVVIFIFFRGQNYDTIDITKLSKSSRHEH